MMKKLMIVPVMLLGILLAATACGSGNVPAPSASPNPTAAASAGKVFNAAELAKYDGQSGNPAYVAVNGKVYDVTLIKAWANGMHNGLTAGKDCSEEIKKSPHGLRVLDMLKVAGEYKP